MSEKTAEQKLQQKYQIQHSIGDGSFGYILSIRNKTTDERFACKIQKNHGRVHFDQKQKFVLVEKQFQIMFSLIHYNCFPKVYEIQKFQENSYIIMEKFDHTLYELHNKHGKKFSLPTVALITEQCFKIMRVLHEAGYLHRDLKPENFMIKNNSHQIKLIDFGLADGTKPKKSSTLLGNVRFSSRGAHFGMSSQKDDLESLIFVLYHLMVNELPWSSATKNEIEQEITRKADTSCVVNTPILKKKHDFVDHIKFPQTKNQIKKALYEQFTELVKYIFELDPSLDPNYDHIDQMCAKLILLAGTKKGSCFDWCHPGCPKKPRGQLWDVFKTSNSPQKISKQQEK